MENKALIDAFNNTYCFCRKRYVIMQNGTAPKTVQHPFGNLAIESHINGTYSLCVFSGDKATRFVTIDVDAGGKKAVHKVIDTFVAMGIPKDRIYVSISGRKGYHIDIFFAPYVYNDKARNLYELMIWQAQLDPRKVEFRPTPGQAIKLPLGVHQATHRRCWFVDIDTLQPIESFDYIYEIKPVDASVINDIIRTWNKKRWSELYAEMICNDTGRDNTIDRKVVFDEAYYESKRLIQKGTRHATFIKIACDLRSYGANRQQIEKALRGFYYRQDPVYIESSEKEVLEDIVNIASWAEESVPIRVNRPSPNKYEMRHIELYKADAEKIIQGSTSASRRIALLIYAYCRIFGSAHISYECIAETTGCSLATAKNAIRDLVDQRIIGRKSGGCHYSNNRLVRRANTYYIPGGGTKDANMFVFDKKVSNLTIDELYYGLLNYFFDADDLKGRLTGTEIKELKNLNFETKISELG